MICALRRFVERGAVFQFDRNARTPCKIEYFRNAVIVRAARYYIDAVEASARFQPFENGVFTVDLNIPSVLFLNKGVALRFDFRGFPARLVALGTVAAKTSGTAVAK